MRIKDIFSKDNFERLGDLFIATWKRYPLTLLMGYLASALVLYRISADIGYDSLIYEIISKLLLTLFLGMAVSVVAEAIQERWEVGLFKRLFSYGVQIIVLGLYYYLVMGHYEMDTVMIRHFMLIGALLFAYTTIPYLVKREGYEFYVIRLVSRFFETLAYTIVLGLGITAILFAIENLLYEGMSGDLYTYTWVLVFGVFAASFFLAGIPKLTEDMERSELGKVLQTIFTYIVLPLLSVYSLVLYLYFFKIIITRNWPSGMVSYLVIFSSAIGALSIFILSPIQEENRWIKNVNTWYPRLVLPLLAMMFVAIFMRIGQYGFSENRYFILLAGLWVTFSYLYFNLRKIKWNITLIIALAVMMLVSVLGPVSAFAVSIRSQNNRFNEILTSNNMLGADGSIQASDRISDEDLNQLYEIVYYFRQNHELTDLKLLPDTINMGKDSDLEALFGAPRPDSTSDFQGKYYSFRLAEDRASLDISDYDAYFSVDYYDGSDRLYEQEMMTDQGLLALTIEDSKWLVISLDGTERYRFDIGSYGELLYHLEQEEGYQSLQEALVQRVENDDVRILLYSNYIRADLLSDGVESIEMDCYVGIR